jgi:fumarate reductase flavoprotein subunit
VSLLHIPDNWDYEADVIVVGGGTAGLPAAVVAAEAGLKVIVLESRPACGGSLNMVVGCFAIAGSDEQKEQGIEDSPEIFYQDMVNICGVEPEMAKAFTDNQLDAYWMLKEQGIEFPGVLPFPCHSRIRGLGWLYRIGPKMVKALENRARERGVEILFRHRATRLITEPQTGRVYGLRVNVNDETKNFKAKRAVILATGGFGRNRELIAEYCPEMVDGTPMMPVSHLGDGLKMGLSVGAATKDIGIAVAPAWPVCIETHLNVIAALRWGGIMVNISGKRFHEESCSEGFYGPMTGAGMKQPGGAYWVVYDERILNDVRANEDQGHITAVEKSIIHKANTIEELANIAGMDTEGLKETVDKYNSDIDSEGCDTVFGRKFQWGPARTLVKIETTPFSAIKCVTAITSMKGGLKINARSQVVNQYGEVIPGLYAAGEVAGGLHTKTYLLGVMTAGSMTLGIIAGRNAIKEPAW